MAEPIAPVTPDYLRQLRLMVGDGVSGYSNSAVASLIAEIDRLQRIINNVSVDLNDEAFPIGHRIEHAASHLLECPEAVFGEFPHGPDAAAKAVSV
jgi:hypothetical protein